MRIFGNFLNKVSLVFFITSKQTLHTTPLIALCQARAKMNTETPLGALVDSRKALMGSQRAIDATLPQHTNAGTAV
jgi:hypothetical protein